ncbi:MAG TPA: carbohydrate-binding family 9-like protein [Pyrinomonadaceae bacterium]
MSQEPIIAGEYSEVSLGANDFEHPAWGRSQAIQITRKWSGEEAPASRHAEARIIWSEESLMVRFICRQREPLVVNPNPQLDKKTIGLWDRDVCEVFIAPDPSRPERYFEFEAAPTGEWVDLAIRLTPDGRETDWEFYSGMTTAARLTGEELTIIIRIPWSTSIPKPKQGDAWRCNLFRCIGKGVERYLAWQPTRTPEPYFHVPEVFGRLDFI